MCSSNQKYQDVEALDQGVGVRQMDLPLFPEGGEYLDNCTISELPVRAPESARRLLDELTNMGLPSIWSRVATEIGADAFINMWQLLDDAFSKPEDDRRVHVPKFSRFERYQRNLFIKSLAASDLSIDEIRAQLHVQGHQLSVRSIERIIED